MLQVGGHCVCTINFYVHDVYQKDSSIAGNHIWDGKGSWASSTLTIGANLTSQLCCHKSAQRDGMHNSISCVHTHVVKARTHKN